MEEVNAAIHPQVPGEPTHTGTALVETATATIQGFGPVNKIHQHLCAYATTYIYIFLTNYISFYEIIFLF